MSMPLGRRADVISDVAMRFANGLFYKRRTDRFV